ncbi:ankyrin repeat domain-containing protein [Pontiella agarivorans]|uniref:Ankyrin repeat domain-containing protein n=1 Tax=Pontiella agarivorans TaxID=3038953 RepID=A0ABU5MWY3_9BACT|nr:ankyrin repeat domain-containing protein [Pontiella agarivorans]MDZ8118715.1 ankyrin repeat domain-containing protein [Pontiella agarivorans]
MHPECLKKGIIAGFIGCVVLLAGSVAAYIHFSAGADAGEANSGWRAGMIVVGGLSGFLCAGLLGAYFFAYRWLGISRIHWRHGRAMTMLDGGSSAGNKPQGETWFFLSVNECLYLVAVLAVVSTLAGFIHTMRKPSAFDCVEHGTVEELRHVLSRYPEQLSQKNSRGSTLLIQAVRSGRPEMVDFILVRRPDINTADRSGRSALMYAVGEPDLVELLLEAGAAPNGVDHEGNTPLLLAVRERCERSCALLLDHGASPNRAGEHAQTPLFLAVSSGLDVFDLLLCHGADPEAEDAAGDTPLHAAARNNHTAAVQLLLQSGIDPAKLSLQGWSPLHLAVLCGSTEVVELLLREGVDVNLANTRKQTPLNCAVYSGNAVLVKLLLESGADISSADQRGNTVLHEALLHENRELADLLIQYGADLDVENAAGISPRLLLKKRCEAIYDNSVAQSGRADWKIQPNLMNPNLNGFSGNERDRT